MCLARRWPHEAGDFRLGRSLVAGNRHERTGLGNTQAKIHLGRLEELEYVVLHAAGRGVAYELVYDGRGNDGTPFLTGLIDLEKLGHGYDAKWSALKAKWSGGRRQRSGFGRPPVGPESGGGRTVPIAISRNADGPKSSPARANDASAHLDGTAAAAASYAYARP
jgi:hypothetical protein